MALRERAVQEPVGRKGSEISSSSYHVCERKVTVNVSKVVGFQAPRKEKVLCRGWLPWKLCSRTYYVTEYRTVFVPDTMVVAECCEGYELLGHYCVMAQEHFSVYTSKPGTCPGNLRPLGPECSTDHDCRGLQKCCVSSNASFCVPPEPPALDRNTMRFWYNGTITIKSTFDDLVQLDPGFTNHTRLLHAMVSGELWPTEAALYHISTAPASPFTVLSHVLIGINESMPLLEIGQTLRNIVTRLPEVIDIHIEDLDECLHPRLGACSPQQQCINMEGSYMCSQPNSTQNPSPASVCSGFSNLNVSNVSSDGFHISWRTDCPAGHLYSVEISSSKGLVWSGTGPRTSLNISGLNAGELYTALVTFQDCDDEPVTWRETVKTEARILNSTLKIENWNLTGSLLDPNSTDYADFVKKFIAEVKVSLSKDVPPEKVDVKILSLRPGSIIASFLIIIKDTPSPISLTAASLSAISNSSEFMVDPHSITITDYNECLSPSDNDCDMNADCRNLEASYTCDCRLGYTDLDPSRPGRTCEVLSLDSLPTDPTSRTYSTPTTDTSSPITSAAARHVTNVTVASIRTATDLPDPTSATTQGLSTSPVLDNSTTAQLPSSAPAMVPTKPDTPGITNTTAMDSRNKTSEDPDLTTMATTSSASTKSFQSNTTGKHNSTEMSSNVSPANVTMTLSIISNRGNTTVLTMSPTMQSSPHVSNVTVASSTIRSTAAREVPCAFSLMSQESSSNSEATHSPLLSEGTTTTQRSPSLSLKDASRVICEMGKIGISIEKNFLKMLSVSSQSLFLGSPECSMNCSTDTHILIQAGWNDCNTDVDSNKTHIVVNSTLYISLSTSFQNITPRPVSQIRCVFQNDILWSSGYNPAGGIYTIIEKLEGGGSFLPEFQLFIGDQPIQPNFTLSATDDITVQIRIKTDDSQYKVVINECWATPTENSNDPTSFPFIKDSCALANTFTTILTNGISSNATFQTKIFSFVNNPIVYLHCRLHVCREEPTKTCKPTCGGFRSAITGDNVFTGVTRMGPLHLARQSNNTDNPAEDTLGVGYIILITVGVLAVIAIIVAILVCWHERKTGNYSFKIKTRDVTYQVFSN
ncbi:uromodulin-like 1 [Gastrophryne carolinensis]